MQKNTIKNLNTKIWYRTAKVIYIIFYAIGLLTLFGGGISEIPSDGWLAGISISLGGSIGVIVFFELIKHIAYYILLGKWSPTKE